MTHIFMVQLEKHRIMHLHLKIPLLLCLQRSIFHKMETILCERNYLSHIRPLNGNFSGHPQDYNLSEEAIVWFFSSVFAIVLRFQYRLRCLQGFQDLMWPWKKIQLSFSGWLLCSYSSPKL